MKCLSQCGVAVNARSIHPIGWGRSVEPIRPWHSWEIVNTVPLRCRIGACPASTISSPRRQLFLPANDNHFLPLRAKVRRCGNTGNLLLVSHLLGMCLTQIITTAAAQVGRAPWPARDALVPLLEAKRKPNAPATRNAARPHPGESSTYPAPTFPFALVAGAVEMPQLVARGGGLPLAFHAFHRRGISTALYFAAMPFQSPSVEREF